MAGTDNPLKTGIIQKFYLLTGRSTWKATEVVTLHSSNNENRARAALLDLGRRIRIGITKLFAIQ